MKRQIEPIDIPRPSNAPARWICSMSRVLNVKLLRRHGVACADRQAVPAGRWLALMILAAWLCGCNWAIAQQIIIVSVRSNGEGVTEAAAVKNAIVEAVGQVSGERISSATTIKKQSRDSASGESERSRTIDSRIDSLIKGVVKSSNTISVERDPATGTYRALVEVRVATYKGSEQLKRIKLSIVRGTQPTPATLGSSAGEFMGAVLAGVSDKIVTSAKFAVLDRSQQEAAQREFSIIASGSAGVENYVRLQSKAIADFLVIIDVPEFVVINPTLLKPRVKSVARAVVYDYTSGQVRQSVSAAAVRTLRDDVFYRVAGEIGGELAEKIIENAFPALVVGFEGSSVFINAGSGQFEVGDLVQFSKRGEPLRDPYTKESIGYAEVSLGEGIVETVLPRVSVVRADGLIARIANPSAISVVARRKKDAPTSVANIDQSLITAPSDSSGSSKRGAKDKDDW